MKDTARIDCLDKISYQYIRLFIVDHDTLQANKDSALYYGDLTLADAKKINYIHGIAGAYSTKAALNFFFDHQFEESERFARESLKWFSATANKKYMENAYWLVGQALFFRFFPDEAYSYFQESYECAVKHGNKLRMYSVLGFIYENYRDIGDYEKAFEAFRKTQQLNLAFNGKIDSFYEFYVLGELHRRIENYPTALKNYRQAMQRIDLNHDDIWFRTGYPELFALNGEMDSAQYYFNLIDSSKLSRHELPFYLVSIGEFHFLHKEYSRSLSLLLHALGYHRAAADAAQTNRALLDVAKTYEALQQDNDAMIYSREGLGLALQTHSKQYIRDAYQILYRIYKRRNISDSAFFYYQKYITQKEAVANDVVKGKFAAYNYDETIVQMNQEKQQQEREIRQANQEKQSLIAGTLILFALGIAVFRNIILKRKTEAGRRSIAENELLLHKLEADKTKAHLAQQATELEMQALRAQMNPHFIFNCLSSINRVILKNESEIASDYLTKFSRLVRMVLNNSQKEAILLEDELEMLRLYFDLERLRFKNTFDYSIVFHNNFDAGSVLIPPLLLQPFAENAIWHGLMQKEGHGFIEVAFSFENSVLNCFISDNGIGRQNAEALKSKSAENQKSMGVQITTRRLALLNRNMEQTSFEIEDVIDQYGNVCGTKVNLKIQYKEERRINYVTKQTPS